MIEIIIRTVKARGKDYIEMFYFEQELKKVLPEATNVESMCSLLLDSVGRMCPKTGTVK